MKGITHMNTNKNTQDESIEVVMKAMEGTWEALENAPDDDDTEAVEKWAKETGDQFMKVIGDDEDTRKMAIVSVFAQYCVLKLEQHVASQVPAVGDMPKETQQELHDMVVEGVIKVMKNDGFQKMFAGVMATVAMCKREGNVELAEQLLNSALDQIYDAAMGGLEPAYVTIGRLMADVSSAMRG